MARTRFINVPVPSDPSIPATTINGGISDADTSVTFASVADLPVAQCTILIDDEYIVITGYAGLVATITRGHEGSDAVAHSDGAAVFCPLTVAGLLDTPRAMTTSGDLEYLDASGRVTRLPEPGDGDGVLRWASGVPSWTDTPVFAGLSLGELTLVDEPVTDLVITVKLGSVDGLPRGVWASVEQLSSLMDTADAVIALYGTVIGMRDSVGIVTAIDAEGYPSPGAGDVVVLANAIDASFGNDGSGGGEVTTAIGYNLNALWLAGGATIINAYGLKIGDIVGATTLNYAIFTEAGLVHFGADVEIVGGVTLAGLPTADPSVAGVVWNDSGTLKVSAG